MLHIANGHSSVNQLKKAFASSESENDEVFGLEDYLNIGPLKDVERPFQSLRTQYLTEINPERKAEEIKDLDQLMALSTRLSNHQDLQLCFWMANNARDVCTYFWLLHYLKKHEGRIAIINLAGLPFLDEDNQLFFPDKISELPEKEIIKSLQLKRMINSSEWETFGDEWKRLVKENSALRILKGAKVIESTTEDYYDEVLLKHVAGEAKRQSTIINHCLREINDQVPALFLEHRYRVLEEQGLISSDTPLEGKPSEEV